MIPNSTSAVSGASFVRMGLRIVYPVARSTTTSTKLYPSSVVGKGPAKSIAISSIGNFASIGLCG
eukprot:CAMPEP_0119155750 /NCGR_PEP_ID=MMETSP1310-20130426/51907_1 /TAXON_ID=464262 /ORGANISM="Genus nov. species nov., Strain RCC2339" /LENGTH=64 /DNA_ID=CAMNT_0007148355 /DNA_START=778 /DNA_END=972 /DNA_ORIENTATION=-